MSDKYEHIIYETRDNITRITMNRPEKLNAMNPKMETELKMIGTWAVGSAAPALGVRDCISPKRRCGR